MAPTLFVTLASPAARATLLTTKALNINVDLEEIDLNNKEQFKPAFLKINPQHTVPTLNDDDFILWDSHVINGYLVDKYGGFSDSLYPSDLEERAKIDQKLHFDSELQLLAGQIFKCILGGQKGAPQEQVDAIQQRYEFLEKFLTASPYVALPQLTIADLSLIATVTSIDLVVPIEAAKFPKITAWLKKAQALPYYSINRNGLEKLSTLLKTALEAQ